MPTSGIDIATIVIIALALCAYFAREAIAGFVFTQLGRATLWLLTFGRTGDSRAQVIAGITSLVVIAVVVALWLRFGR